MLGRRVSFSVYVKIQITFRISLCPMGIPLLQTMVRINESLHKHKEGETAGLLNVADVSIHYRQRARTCHNIGPARERAFISVCENKGIKNNIYTIGVSKSTLVIGRAVG